MRGSKDVKTNLLSKRFSTINVLVYLVDEMLIGINKNKTSFRLKWFENVILFGTQPIVIMSGKIISCTYNQFR
ncbi:hypothetical protein BLOT_007363 [Blomia tropicalis]|nr:hypothetical protein BLOT_007363 [Blomia tropicalis]